MHTNTIPSVVKTQNQYFYMKYEIKLPAIYLLPKSSIQR